MRLLPAIPLLLLLAPSPAAAGEDWGPALLRPAGVDLAQLRCNRENRWADTLRQEAREGAAELMSLMAPSPALWQEGADALQRRLQAVLRWRMVRAVLIGGNNNNLGAFVLRGRSWVDGAGKRRPVLIFRSGLTPDPAAPESCFRSLLTAGGVRHVVNLFDGEIPARDLLAAESRAAAGAGASYSTATDDPATGYGPWRDQLRSQYDDAEQRRQASRAVARLIREQILLPRGAPPAGNIHLHCDGGMHRTGMIAGVIERCLGREPLDVVEAHYRYHVGYRDPAHPGGLEEGNLRFIREFDCGLLGPEATR